MSARSKVKIVQYVIVLLFFFVVAGWGPEFITQWADQRMEATEQHRRMTSPVWLEHDNIQRRGRHFAECKEMPPLPGDGPYTCAEEAFSLFPNRNWKKIAADNAAKGL